MSQYPDSAGLAGPLQFGLVLPIRAVSSAGWVYRARSVSPETRCQVKHCGFPLEVNAPSPLLPCETITTAAKFLETVVARHFRQLQTGPDFNAETGTPAAVVSVQSGSVASRADDTNR